MKFSTALIASMKVIYKKILSHSNQEVKHCCDTNTMPLKKMLPIGSKTPKAKRISEAR
jgi:hypothetical protein